MTVVTRFAPSPTGYLHIGGAHTALFNWLFSKHYGGKFLLRIEDTDRVRSTEEATNAILDGLSWLGLDWDGEAYSQFARRDAHVAAAERLLAEGKAYRCYCTPEELAEMRDTARKEGRSKLYDGRWRDRDPAEAPEGIKPSIRMKAPQDGVTVIDDAIQGPITVENAQMDDMVLLRGDFTPTYMLAVVVDDHDMGITHVIRGDDHLTNAFRQYQLYQLLGWDVPVFAHMPLIHGPDGAKLSKRHGAVRVESYRDDGFLPESMRNYLLRLGWSHGDDEIISTEQAIEWFDLPGVVRSPARFDATKLLSLNGHYIRQADSQYLTDLVMPHVETSLNGELADEAATRIMNGMGGLKERAKTILELAEKSAFYAKKRPLIPDDKAKKQLDGEALDHLKRLRKDLGALDEWTLANIEEVTRQFAETKEIKLGKAAQPLRAALTGTTVSPGIFEVIEVLGKTETLGRLDDVL
jgi:glutamyl-tRNA synthetase